jgi:hypothetical protein
MFHLAETFLYGPYAVRGGHLRPGRADLFAIIAT